MASKPSIQFPTKEHIKVIIKKAYAIQHFACNSITVKIQIKSQTMKAFLCQANPQNPRSLLAPFCPNQNNYSFYTLAQSQCFKPSNMKMSQGWRLVQRRKGDNRLAVGCVNWSLEAELQRELAAEMKQQQQEGEGIGMARFRHKCEEGKGLVELLECLEREAIMGEDVGKEPLDYNRRARIFDTSSRVIQALRQHQTSVSPQ